MKKRLVNWKNSIAQVKSFSPASENNTLESTENKDLRERKTYSRLERGVMQ